MAKQVAKSALAGKLAGKIKTNEVEVKLPAGGGRLPPGIENGVARLVDARIGTYGDDTKMAGEPFLLMAGVVVNPDGSKNPYFVPGPNNTKVRVDGLRTQITEPLCDTPSRSRKTVQEHYDWCVNEVAKLLDKKPGEKFWIDVDDMEGTLEALKEAAPYFKFRTWAGMKQDFERGKDGKWRVVDVDANGKTKPSRNTMAWPSREAAEAANPYVGRDPMVNEVWSGYTEFQAADDSEPDTTVQDDSGDATEPEVQEPAAEERDIPFGDDLDDLVAAANRGDKKSQAAIDELGKRAMAQGYTEAEVEAAENWEAVAEMVRSPKQEEGESGSDDEEQVDWMEVAAKAGKNKDKGASVKQLNAKAKSLGLNPDNFDTYEEQAQAIIDVEAGDGEKQEENQDAPVPAKGEVWNYKAEGMKKSKEVEIVSVNAKKRTAEVKDNTTKKKFDESVSWDDLTP